MPAVNFILYILTSERMRAMYLQCLEDLWNHVRKSHKTKGSEEPTPFSYFSSHSSDIHTPPPPPPHPPPSPPYPPPPPVPAPKQSQENSFFSSFSPSSGNQITTVYPNSRIYSLEIAKESGIYFITKLWNIFQEVEFDLLFLDLIGSLDIGKMSGCMGVPKASNMTVCPHILQSR